jgi:spore coat protein CotF
MNECNELTEYLTLTKSLCMLYINGTIEAVNKDTRKLMLDGLKETLEMQNDLYNSLVALGYYTVENCNSSAISKLYNKLNQDN